MTEESLWSQILGLLSHHQKPKRDAAPLDAINRLFGEHFKRGARLPRITPQTWTARVEHWSTAELARLRRKDHDARDPRHKSYPVVAVLYRADYFLIDGRRRVNRWLYENAPGSHIVLVISSRDTSSG